jgi:hypothetical protein
MKSPIRSVGIIEPEGIRNGSTTNALSTKTNAKTGKNDLENLSTTLFFRTALPNFKLLEFFLSVILYITIMSPVLTDNKKSIAVKSQTIINC